MAEFSQDVGNGVTIALDGYTDSNEVTGTKIKVKVENLNAYSVDRSVEISTTVYRGELIPQGVNANVTTADGMADAMARKMVGQARATNHMGDSTSHTGMRKAIVEDGNEGDLAAFDRAWAPGGAIEKAVAAQLREEAAKETIYESQGEGFDASKMKDADLNKIIHDTIDAQGLDNDFWAHNGRNSLGTGARWVKSAIKSDAISRKARQDAAGRRESRL